MRLIDAEKLKAHYAWWKGGTAEKTLDEMKTDFDTIIDLQPSVNIGRHGHWTEKVVEHDNVWLRRRWVCSACGSWQTYGTPPFCPRCGAQMDEGSEEE